MTAKINRALLSVSDKAGLVDFARGLAQAGVALVSTGGTAATLRLAGLAVEDVSAVTGFPEMLDGRVKTLHPNVHGGLLAVRGNAEHEAAMVRHGIAPIDLLAVDLYPFETAAAERRPYDACIEAIDIGGPAMIRAAAKNHGSVTVVVDPADYPRVLSEMHTNGGATTLALRRELAAKAFARTAAFDAAVSGWFAETLQMKAPAWRCFAGRLRQELRYGENPHQWAALYVSHERRPGVATAVQHQGKELSYNNLNDTDAAFELAAEFDPAASAAAVIVKHANPCGAAIAGTPLDAYRSALRCDLVSAFGGIVALNRPIDREAAAEIVRIFTEVVIAPDASSQAKAIFAAKPNLRLLTTGTLPDRRAPGISVRTLAGGLLVQSRDNTAVEDLTLNVVTRRPPSAVEMADLIFAFTVAKHVKSNAIVYAKNGATTGIGAGQTSRVDAVRIAAWKSAEAAQGLEPLSKGSVAASDAFFPFADGLLATAQAGATAVIQPGGSVRDEEVVAAADAHNLAMVFTGVRHFRH